MASEVTYTPREAGSSEWVDGSRDRYGEAYFVSERSDGRWTLWQNRRPYAPNVEVDVFAEKPTTWANLDAVIRRERFIG